VRYRILRRIIRYHSSAYTFHTHGRISGGVLYKGLAYWEIAYWRIRCWRIGVLGVGVLDVRVLDVRVLDVSVLGVSVLRTAHAEKRNGAWGLENKGYQMLHSHAPVCMAGWRGAMGLGKTLTKKPTPVASHSESLPSIPCSN